MKINSKGFNWELMDQSHWQTVADEFIPVALRWKEKRKRSVLDLGCGIGRNTLFLAELGFNVTAVDLSEAGIKKLELEAAKTELTNNVRTVVCDMLKLPFKPKEFDCVLAFHSVYHTDFNGLRSVITTISRILKDDGELYITFNSKQNPDFKKPSNISINDHTIIKTEGIEKDIPHTYIAYRDVIDFLSDFKISKVQHIQEIYDTKSSWHYFVEAQKVNV